MVPTRDARLVGSARRGDGAKKGRGAVVSLAWENDDARLGAFQFAIVRACFVRDETPGSAAETVTDLDGDGGVTAQRIRELLQVAESAVDQAAGPARGAVAQVALLEEAGAEAPERRV